MTYYHSLHGIHEEYDEDSGFGFADPYGRSALRATHGDKCPHCRTKVGTTAKFCRECGFTLNPRIYPCPTCKAKNRLTLVDTKKHYQCDSCADRDEGIGHFRDY